MNICILIHTPRSLVSVGPQGDRKTASFRRKSPCFRSKVSRFRAFVREKSAPVATLGRNHALRRAKMRGGKSWRAGKKTVSLRRYAAHAIFLLSRPAVPHASRRPSARAGTRPATVRALLRAPRVALSTPTFHPIFLPLQQPFHVRNTQSPRLRRRQRNTSRHRSHHSRWRSARAHGPPTARANRPSPTSWWAIPNMR